MPTLDVDIPRPSVPLSQCGRALHDIGLASLFGGNLFARVGVHPALRKVSDPAERGRVVTASWRRYGAVNSLALVAVVTGWAGARANEAANGRLSARERGLTYAKDGLVAATALTGVAAAVEGLRFNAETSGGNVPLADGSTPSAETPESPARTKRLLNTLGRAHLACTGALIAVNASLAQENFRRPPLRRVLGRA